MIIIVGRVMGVISTFYCFRLCFKKKTIKFRELLFITYAGMIRGAIAFALVLKIQYYSNTVEELECEECYSQESYDLAVSTTLMLVMMTTLLFGTFMDPVQKILVPPKPAPEQRANTWVSENLIKQDHRHGSDISHHEEIFHPNEEKSMISDAPSRRPSYLLATTDGFLAKPNSWVDSKFVKWFVDFDETVLRPFLIYKYDLKQVMAEDQYEEYAKNQMKNAKTIEERKELMNSYRT